jgi:hypothetical protein
MRMSISFSMHNGSKGGGGGKRRRVQSRVRNEVLGALTCGHANVHGRLELVVKGKRGQRLFAGIPAVKKRCTTSINQH